MPSKFAYRLEHFEPLGSKRLEEELNAVGATGWDVFHIERTADGGRLVYMKKELPVTYDIPEHEYETITNDDFYDNPPNQCQLCGFVFGQHHPHCPVHPDNIDKSGLEHCDVCGWTYYGIHSNPRCENYEEKQE